MKRLGWNSQQDRFGCHINAIMLLIIDLYNFFFQQLTRWFASKILGVKHDSTKRHCVGYFLYNLNLSQLKFKIGEKDDERYF